MKHAFAARLGLFAMGLAFTALLFSSCGVLGIFPNMPAFEKRDNPNFPYDAHDTFAPGKVDRLTGNANANQVALYWTNPPDEDLAAVRIEWDPWEEGFDNPRYIKTPGDQTIISGLREGVEYYFRLFTLDFQGNMSEETGIPLRTTPGGDVSSPPELAMARIEAAQTNEATFSLHSVSDPMNTEAVKVEISWFPKTSSTQPIVTLELPPASDRLETIRELVADTSYTFLFRTLDMAGNRSKGIIREIHTPSINVPEVNSFEFGDVMITSTQIEVRWTDPPNMTDYSLILSWFEVDNPNAKGSTVIERQVPVIYSHVISGLKSKTAYDIRLQVVDMNGHSSFGKSLYGVRTADF